MSSGRCSTGPICILIPLRTILRVEYIKYWKECVNVQSKEIQKLEQEFLESYAFDYPEHEDHKSMMKFVQEFYCMESKHVFLRSLVDVIKEADLLEKVGYFKETAVLLLLTGGKLHAFFPVAGTGGTVADVSCFSKQIMGDHGNSASLMRDMLEKSSSSVAGTSEGHAHGYGYGTEEFDGCTLLHLACETTDVRMIELLLQYGANITCLLVVVADPSLGLKQRLLVRDAARALEKAKMMHFC
nr:UvrD-like helicase, ATP-binding domain, P-loop containing nucleoside triphosphate hydrolase [Tanacetum cinerariifolium]